MHHARIDFGEIDLRRPISPKSALRNASQRLPKAQQFTLPSPSDWVLGAMETKGQGSGSLSSDIIFSSELPGRGQGESRGVSTRLSKGSYILSSSTETVVFSEECLKFFMCMLAKPPPLGAQS